MVLAAHGTNDSECIRLVDTLPQRSARHATRLILLYLTAMRRPMPISCTACVVCRCRVEAGCMLRMATQALLRKWLIAMRRIAEVPLQVDIRLPRAGAWECIRR